jgi:hypothetical protein
MVRAKPEKEYLMRSTIAVAALVALLLGTAARAEVTYQWNTDTDGLPANYYRHTLTVSSNEGAMTGFDIALMGANINSGSEFNPTVDDNTHFLLQENHGFPATTDLTVGTSGVNSSALWGGFTVASGGLYEGGWTSLDLLQFVSETTDYPELSDSSASGPGLARIGTGDSAYLTEIVVPEPVTMLVLAGGGVALLGRRRKSAR